MTSIFRCCRGRTSLVERSINSNPGGPVRVPPTSAFAKLKLPYSGFPSANAQVLGVPFPSEKGLRKNPGRSRVERKHGNTLDVITTAPLPYVTKSGEVYVPVVRRWAKNFRKSDKSTWSYGLRERKLTKDVAKAVKGAVKALFTLLRIYGMRDSPGQSKSYHETVKHWVVGSKLSGSWIKYVKYKLAAFFHARTSQMDLPPALPFHGDVLGFSENASILCCGSAGRYANLLANTNQSFLASILQLKKGCPRPDGDMVQAAVEKACIALTTTRATRPSGVLLPWGDVEAKFDGSIYLDRPSTELQLRRTVRELFRDETYGDSERYRMIFPSTSASHEDARTDGGAFRSVQTLAKAYNLHRGSELHDTVFTVSRDGKIEVTDRWRATAKRHIGFKQVAGSPEEESISQSGAARHYSMDLSELQERAMVLQIASYAEASAQVSRVKPVGLAEALKVRVITKGMPLIQKALHPLQKFMWRVLRKHRVMKLIGEPCTARVVQAALGAKLNDDEYYLSGDYAAATDNLAPWVSECIADEISAVCGLTGEENTLFRTSLTGNEILCSDGVYRKQLWGQLMGSIVSFPVLCIANAALSRWAYEVDRQRITPLANVPMLINGDDIVLRTTLRGHKLWERITAFAGLETSIGKTFLTKAFAQINSINFLRLEEPVDDQVDGKVRSLYFAATEYVNMGLLFGLKRSGEKVGIDSIASDTSLGVRCRELIRSCPKVLRERVMGAFLRHHAAMLEKCNVPWFIPEEWGGVGLPTVPVEADYVDYEPGQQEPVYHRWGPRRLDLQIARRIAEPTWTKVQEYDVDASVIHESDVWRERVVLAKPKFPVGRPPMEAPWMVHKYVLSHIPAPLVLGYPTEREKSLWAACYAALCYEAFLSDATLYNGETTPVAMKVLKQNARSWKLARRSGSLPPPMSAKALYEQQPPQPYLPIDSISALYEQPRRGRDIVLPDDVTVTPWSFAGSDDRVDLWA